MSKVIKNTNNKWWQIFKSGNHLTKAGNQFSADENKLAEIISATQTREYANDEVPIVLGHPKENSPQFGAFKNNGFKSAGGILLGKYEYLVPEFAECISRRMYNKISIALYPDNAIRHIGFFGALQTSLKDLAPVELSLPDEEYISIEFSSEELPGYEVSRQWFANINSILSNIKSYISSDRGEAAAEEVIPAELLNGLNSSAENKTNNDDKSSDDEREEFSEKFTEIQSVNNALILENTELKKKLFLSEIKEFAESPAMKKKITPALLPHITQLYIDLNSISEEFEFSENEGEQIKQVKSTRGASFKKILMSLPDAVEFGDFAKRKDAAGSDEDINVSEFFDMNVNDESMELHRKALKLQRDENISYREAVARAIKN